MTTQPTPSPLLNAPLATTSLDNVSAAVGNTLAQEGVIPSQERKELEEYLKNKYPDMTPLIVQATGAQQKVGTENRKIADGCSCINMTFYYFKGDITFLTSSPPVCLLPFSCKFFLQAQKQLKSKIPKTFPHRKWE